MTQWSHEDTLQVNQKKLGKLGTMQRDKEIILLSFPEG